MRWYQIVLLCLAAITWIGGGNVLVAYHYRRTGKPWWSGFKPFAFPFAHFNGREWLIFLGLLVAAICFGVAALGFHPSSAT